MDSNISAEGNALTANAARFHQIYASHGAWGTAIANDQIPMSNSGTLKNLYVEYTNAPGAGITRTFTLYKNGVATALTCTTADNGTTAQDLDAGHAVSYVAGDLLAIATTASATTASSGTISWTLLNTMAANVSQVAVNSGVNIANGSNSYLGLMGFSPYDLTAANVEMICPTGGTFKNLYVQISGSPGGVGKSYQFEVYKNGSPTGLTATCADTATTANDTTHSFSVVAGDLLYIQNTPTGTPTLRQVLIGIEFDPTVNGESIQMRTEPTTLVNSAVRYFGIQGALTANSSENVASMLAQTCNIRKFYGKISAAPGAGKSRLFETSVEGVAGNPSFTIADAATTGQDTTNNINVTAGNMVAIKATPSGTPNLGFAATGLVTYIAPATGRAKFLTLLGVS